MADEISCNGTRSRFLVYRVMGACLCEEDAPGKDDVGNDPSTDDHSAVSDGPIAQQVWVVCRVLHVGIIIWEPHIAAKGYATERVLHLRPLQYTQALTADLLQNMLADHWSAACAGTGTDCKRSMDEVQAASHHVGAPLLRL